MLEKFIQTIKDCPYSRLVAFASVVGSPRVYLKITYTLTWNMSVETRSWIYLSNIKSIWAFETHVLHYMYFYFTDSKAQLLFGSCVIHTFRVPFTLSQLHKHGQSSFESAVVDFYKHDSNINTIYCLFPSLTKPLYGNIKWHVPKEVLINTSNILS